MVSKEILTATKIPDIAKCCRATLHLIFLGLNFVFSGLDLVANLNGLGPIKSNDVAILLVPVNQPS